MIYKAKISNGATRFEIGRLIKEILDEAEKDLETSLSTDDRLLKNNTSTKSWIQRFVQRHSDLSLRKPEQLGHMRKRVSEANLGNWCSNLVDFLLDEHQIVAKDFFITENANRIFNLDETGFPLSGGT